MGIFDKKEQEKASADVRRANRAINSAKRMVENLMREYQNSVEIVWNTTKTPADLSVGLKNDGKNVEVGPQEVINALGSNAAEVLNLQKDIGDLLAKYNSDGVAAIKSKIGTYSVANGKVVLS